VENQPTILAALQGTAAAEKIKKYPIWGMAALGRVLYAYPVNPKTGDRQEDDENDQKFVDGAAAGGGDGGECERGDCVF
jgi:hypothetical protein